MESENKLTPVSLNNSLCRDNDKKYVPVKHRFHRGSNTTYIGFPGGLVAKNPQANEGDPGSIPDPRRSPGEGNDNPSSILPGKSYGQRSLADYSPWGHKELNMTERLNINTT